MRNAVVMRNAKDFLKSKTTWAGLAAIAAAIGSYFGKEYSFSQAEQQIVIALLGIFLRDTIAKGQASSCESRRGE